MRKFPRTGRIWGPEWKGADEEEERVDRRAILTDLSPASPSPSRSSVARLSSREVTRTRIPRCDRARSPLDDLYHEDPFPIKRSLW